MTVVNNVERLHIGAHHPVQHFLVTFPHIIEVQGTVANDTFISGHYLLAGYFVASTVNRVKQGFSRVYPRAEELHLFTDSHGGNATGNGSVIAPLAANLIIGFILDRGSFDGNLRAELFIAFRQTRGPENSDIGFGCRPQIY